jgi:uncharacterized protein YdeI (YjbR/CyaY-like superfamily)
MDLATFTSRQSLRAWLAKNHQKANELFVRCYKVSVKDKGLTYREALDEALCFGWIRLDSLIDCSARGVPIKQLDRNPAKSSRSSSAGRA